MIDKTGVLVIVSHLIITLVILAIYAFTVYTGNGDKTLETIITVVIGYWFGAMGKDMITKKSDEDKQDKIA